MSEKSKKTRKRRKRLAEAIVKTENEIPEVSVSKATEAIKDFEIDSSKTKVAASTEVSDPIDPLEVCLDEDVDYDDTPSGVLDDIT